VAEGTALIDKALQRAGATTVWFDGDLRYWKLYAALVTRGLTPADLEDATVLVRDWRYRRRLAELRRELAIQLRRFPEALEADREAERLDRDAGRESAPATSAYLLASLNRRREASEALSTALERLPRLHFAARPHYRVAQALLSLGRRDEAIEHAKLAYRQAWRDGPPASDHWALRDVRELLAELGEVEPSLRITDPDTVTVPMENDVRAFIQRLETAPFAAST
jgi:tetratricopeptide (TPR) repeat protein